MDCLESKDPLEPADDSVRVVTIEFDAVPASPSLLGGDESCSTSGERIADDAAAPGTIQDRVRNPCHRLDGRVHHEIAFAALGKAVCSLVLPPVGPVAPKPAQCDIIDMRRPTILEHKDQLMLRSVQTPHPGIGFRPDTKVLDLAIGLRGSQELPHVAPIHTNEV